MDYDDRPAEDDEDRASRRTFLKAAVLGVGAAAIHQGFNPVSAYANDLSSFQCTANDVRIVGPGRILNEPCSCTGTFNAQVAFTVENNAGADRYCITLHLCPTVINGQTVNLGDVVLQGSISGKTTQVMTATIPNYPCGAGLVCFGSSGGNGDGTFAKGERCPDGACCSTVTWNVRANDSCPVPAGTEISSKCRHQSICIQGRGAVTLDCDTSASGVQTDCTVQCGSSATLRLCTSGGVGPFTFRVAGGGFDETRSNSSNLCETFTIPSVTATTVFTGSVTDADGCTRSAQVTLRTSPVTPVIAVNSSNCNGVLTISASVAGFTGCSHAWTIDGAAAANTTTDTLLVRVNSNGTLDYRNLDNTCHTIGVTSTCGNCSGTASVRVKQNCVVTTTGCT